MRKARRALFTICLLFLCGCSSGLLGRIILPDLGKQADGLQPVYMNGIFEIPCLLANCFFTYGITQGSSAFEYSNLEVITKNSVDLVWTVEAPVGSLDAKEWEMLAIEEDDCELNSDYRLLPKRTKSLACAVKRVSSLLRNNKKIPNIHITITLIPYDLSVRRVWLSANIDTIQLHFVSPLSNKNRFELADLSGTITHETFHALIAKGYLRNFASSDEEETAAYMMEECAFASVAGSNFIKKWPKVHFNNTSTALGLPESINGRAAVEAMLFKNSDRTLKGNNSEQMSTLFNYCSGLIR